MKTLTEIFGVSVSLEDLGLKNSPGTAIYHYYFTEATLRGRRIYRFGSEQKPSLICVIPGIGDRHPLHWKESGLCGLNEKAAAALN